ncbi:hypothetical protein [uncultured Fusobacterium sp.]|uniref:hypothetical protein n=1 Tax=uncultured Fusobacterium sp. TaxID=159267 RepID=UPI0025D9591B|nr:hypothetical protein [uncultured Fusobacterium sp.]
MEGIYIKGTIMPKTTENILKHFSGLNDDEFLKQIRDFERAAVGIIEASINLDKLKKTENGAYVISSLCKNYVLAKMYEHIAHVDYIDLGADMMVDFRSTLKSIREAQLEENISTDESKKAKNLYIR